MDPRWCPVLLAALAGSLCSAPALAERKFGKILSQFCQFCQLLLPAARLGSHQRVKLHNGGVWTSPSGSAAAPPNLGWSW